MGLSIQPVTEPGLVSYYTIAGRLIRIEACDESSGQWVTNFLDGFQLIQTANTAASQSIITLRIGRDAARSIPSGLQSFAINHGVCYTDGARYFLVVDESLIVIAAPQSHLVEVWFGETPHARHPTALVNVFSYGLQAALRRAGVYDVHAAGVLEPQTGAGALFVGASGSGKTTLTLKLTERGWRYLSDDMIVLRETPCGLEAAGLRRLFSVAAPSLAGSQLLRLDEALGPPVASDPNKRRLDPEIVFPAGRARSARPRVLFFPQITDAAETVIKALPARTAMQQLVRFCPWATYDTQSAPDYLRVLARLANQCRAYELRAGRDLLREPATAAQLLAPYMTA